MKIALGQWISHSQWPPVEYGRKNDVGIWGADRADCCQLHWSGWRRDMPSTAICQIDVIPQWAKPIVCLNLKLDYLSAKDFIAGLDDLWYSDRIYIPFFNICAVVAKSFRTHRVFSLNPGVNKSCKIKRFSNRMNQKYDTVSRFRT